MNTIVSLFRGQGQSRDRFTRLLRPYVEIMYRMAYRWTGHRDRAEELVQDTLASLVPRIDELAALDDLKPWLLKVLYRRFVDTYRRQARSPEVLETDLNPSGAVAWEGEGRSEMTDGARERDPCITLDLQRRLQQALDGLEPAQRNVVLLHDAEGFTDTEIAQILSISKGTVKSRLHRGRKKLKKFLTQGTILDSVSC